MKVIASQAPGTLARNSVSKVTPGRNCPAGTLRSSGPTGGAMNTLFGCAIEPIGIEPIGELCRLIEPIGIEPIGIEPSGIEPIGIEPIGIEPIGEKAMLSRWTVIEPIGIEPIGIEPIGIEPIGIEPIGIEPIGIEPIGAPCSASEMIVVPASAPPLPTQLIGGPLSHWHQRVRMSDVAGASGFCGTAIEPIGIEPIGIEPIGIEPIGLRCS